MVFRKPVMATCLFWMGLAASLGVFGAGPAAAQDANATITGTVNDEQGQVIPGATITLTNESTKMSRSLVSDARGDSVSPRSCPEATRSRWRCRASRASSGATRC